MHVMILMHLHVPYIPTVESFIFECSFQPSGAVDPTDPRTLVGGKQLCVCLQQAVYITVRPLVCVLALKLLYDQMDKNQPDVPLLVFMNVSVKLTLSTNTKLPSRPLSIERLGMVWGRGYQYTYIMTYTFLIFQNFIY